MYRYYLLSATAIAVLTAFLSADVTPSGAIAGIVRARESSVPIAGATVVVLKDGVFPVGTATTIGDGSFSFSGLPEGVYDVQAGAPERKTETLIDVPTGKSVQVSLPAVEDVFSAGGISTIEREDTDGDGLPDLLEKHLTSNPLAPDSNADGIPDRIERAAGINPMHGAISSTSAPVILYPKDRSLIPTSSSAAPAAAFVLTPVSGGTRYDLRFTPNTMAPVRTLTVDYLSSELLLGDKAVAFVPLPSDMAAGSYMVTAQAYHGAGAIGLPSKPVSITLTPRTPAPFAPTSNVEFSGDTVIFASSVLVPQGVTVRVKDGTLRLFSTGPVQVLGYVLGSDGAVAGAAGSSIEIASTADILVQGRIIAGRGANGASTDVSASAGGETLATAGPGGIGGNVLLMSRAKVRLTSSALVASGMGGSGGAARATGAIGTARSMDGQPAKAVSGKGGRGGDLRVFAREGFILAPERKILHSGNGGKGGDAVARGGAGSLPRGLGGLATAIVATGGESGDLSLPTLDVNFVADNLSDLGWINGGAAGAAGAGTVEPGKPAEPPVGVTLIDHQQDPREKMHKCECPESRNGVDHKPPAGQAGEAGWAEPGNGAPAKAQGTDAVGCGNGGAAVAIGGEGGRLKGIELSIGYVGGAWSSATAAGNGGDAEATGGRGGYHHGLGGSAEATAGKGGDAPAAVAGMFNTGGAGGSATAAGGSGDSAPSCCYVRSGDSLVSGQALDGGDGNNASAKGGAGGEGWRGGKAGNALANGGGGGRGGHGRPPGKGGKFGKGDAVAGDVGVGLFKNGFAGWQLGVNGPAGAGGNGC